MKFLQHLQVVSRLRQYLALDCSPQALASLYSAPSLMIWCLTHLSIHSMVNCREAQGSTTYSFKITWSYCPLMQSLKKTKELISVHSMHVQGLVEIMNSLSWIFCPLSALRAKWQGRALVVNHKHTELVSEHTVCAETRIWCHYIVLCAVVRMLVVSSATVSTYLSLYGH